MSTFIQQQWKMFFFWGLTSLVLGCYTLSPVWGDELSVLDHVRLNTFGLQAADTEVMLYIGWDHDDPQDFKEAAQQAVKEVKDLIREDESLNPPPELKELVGSQKRALKKQVLLYQGIETKDEAALKSGYKSFNDDLRVFFKNQEDAVDEEEKAQPANGHLVPLAEEMKFCADPAAAKTYQQGVELNRKKKYAEALQKLQPLLKPYAGTAFGACVALRVSDALALDQDPSTPTPSAKGEDANETDPALDLLNDIVVKAPYSPVIFEAFLKWRTLTQEGLHGMSNFSDIPNNEYNLQRERLLKIVREYQKAHPQDAWAEVQAETFLIQPNIDRGGMSGNTNLSFWGSLYTAPRYYYDSLKKKSAQ